MYADDLVIFTSGKNTSIIRKKLQKAINKLEEWCNKTGFQFSSTETKGNKL